MNLLVITVVLLLIIIITLVMYYNIYRYVFLHFDFTDGLYVNNYMKLNLR